MNQSENAEDRRISNDRRKFTYTAYSPERRSGIDRRNESNKINAKVA